MASVWLALESRSEFETPFVIFWQHRLVVAHKWLRRIWHAKIILLICNETYLYYSEGKSMAEYNQYQAPSSQVDGATAEQYGEMKYFGASGRIGRVRFLAYSIAANFLLMLGVALLGALAKVSMGSAAAPISGLLIAVFYILAFVYAFMLAIRRAHDFNASGWLSLLILVPLVSLIFLFIPGTKGENNYGAPPPPNTTGNILLASILPVIMVVGILAAIAIPAYQGYIQKAQEAKQQQQLQQQR
jgi:uncharacterized membrane protein YhaH (DUF805 family)